MFNFMKKSGGGVEKDEKEKKKKEKKERKENKKRERGSMTAEELLRLDEVIVGPTCYFTQTYPVFFNEARLATSNNNTLTTLN